MEKERFFYDSAVDFTTCVELLTLKEARDLIKGYIPHADEIITILYKDGTIDVLDESYDGHKIKLIDIVSVVECNPNTYSVYGTFEVNDCCVVTVSDMEIIDVSVKEVDSWDYSESSKLSETSEKIIKVGDKISCCGMVFEVAEIIEQEPFSWRDAYHVEFYDTRGDYHFWKQYIDGGFLVG